MGILLKQSTAATVLLGPFLDDTDGKTAETALSIVQADIRLSKNGGDPAQTNNSAGATHKENGYYAISLDTTDTGTLGRLKVMVSKSGALPCWAELMVVPANVYNSLVSGTDYLDVSTGGAGAITWTYTLTNSVTGLPIADADIWACTDAPGTNVIASGKTDANGIVTFYLDMGTTIYIFRQKSGFDFTNPQSFVVS